VVDLNVVAREDWVDHGRCWKCFSYRRLWRFGKRYRAFPRFENGWIQALEGASMELGARVGASRMFYMMPVRPVRLCILMHTAGLTRIRKKNAYTNVLVQTATNQPKGRGSHTVDCLTVLCPAHEVVDHVQWSKVRAVGRLHIVSN
jgi:hypothetical protein